ncbi:MAG TPA: hypothetical protein VH040_08175 [Usitatibacter sp.]|nr:hypothetical protein [Usitatibacter sp.]
MHASRFEGWLPIRVFWQDGAPRLDWCYFGDQRLTDPFFRGSVGEALNHPFNLAFRRETPIDALEELREARPGLEPTAFLFHASRCGSTLVSQMLAALGTHIVISEPPTIDSVLRAHYFAPVDDDTRIRWLRGLVSALAQPRHGETRFFVKLDAWNVFELAVLRKAFPRTPWIYLYRDPLEIAVSQMKERAAYMIPGVLGPALQFFDPREVSTMPHPQFVARVLGKMLEAGNTGCNDAGGIALHYAELPGASWNRLRTTLGIDDGPRALELMQEAARRHAKHPHFEFVPDSQRKQNEASPDLRRVVEQWAGPAYRALERTRATREPAAQPG